MALVQDRIDFSRFEAVSLPGRKRGGLVYRSELGGLYRMGDYSPDRHNEVLPAVKRFVEAYTASPLHEHAGAAGRQAPPPVQDDSVIPAVKGKLRDFLENLPDAVKPDPKGDGGGGVRG